MSERIVLVTDHPWPAVEAEVETLERVGAQMLFATTGSEDELVELVREAEAILTCHARVTPAVIDAGKQLKVIGRYGVGVDNIAVDEATRRGIPVTNVPSYCEEAVAEHVLALLFGLARRILVYDRGLRTGDWSLAQAMPIHQIAGSTIGIIGLGKIGQLLAARARALGMSVVAHHPRRSDEAVRALGVEPVSKLELAARSDFVTLHVPQTEETRQLIDREFLRAMKPTAFLINAARGGVVDTAALAQALTNGWIAGAGLDVFERAPLPPSDPLLAAPNVIATPHVAYYTEESLLTLGRRSAAAVAEVLEGKRPSAVVNPEVFSVDPGHCR